ncbi:cell surface protein [Grosmannia clavigera kw1407]|uniref:Cell surface protein n=1 Tax=Grosmannia clavigera (strain kw1407 / UAMH 11150) TaxID=655863 RepID=F0XSB4_GROCL|nr:cell surface protein [Grosmannia clavigera kw1407]EFW99418.1 cell surface protein [Grosmannia clavigera kw1407]
MFARVLLLALAASPLVAAHGKIAVITGDAGGNTTAIGIKGAVIPGAGSNSKTEVDTTVFSSTKIATNGLGRTNSQGKNTVSMVAQAQELSGSTLPQVSATNGSLSGTFHIVTTDGAGPLQAIVDTTGTGAFASGTKAEILTQVPGDGGEIKSSGVVRRFMVKVGIAKRAANVNKDFPVAVSIPAGTTCNGTVNGLSNVCLIKIANSNSAGPFGGVVAFQMASNTTVKRAVEFTS